MPESSYRYLERSGEVSEFAAGLGGEDRFALDLVLERRPERKQLAQDEFAHVLRRTIEQVDKMRNVAPFRHGCSPGPDCRLRAGTRR